MFSKKTSSSAATASQSALFERPSEERITPTQANMAPAKPMTVQRQTPVAAAANEPSPSSALKEDTMTNQTSKPAPAPTFRSDFRNEANRTNDPVRRVDLSGTAPARGGADTEATRKLVVGREISLNGEISTCDYLVVEGTVEARVREGRRIEIAESGLFKGTVEIDDADIAGRFEGDIIARGRLRVRSTGSITGKVQYGELEIEAGGRIDGSISSLKPGKPEPKSVQARSATPISSTGPEAIQASLATETA
jgi:cytoskeletal protein CcmA (bactofilin family)